MWCDLHNSTTHTNKDCRAKHKSEHPYKKAHENINLHQELDDTDTTVTDDTAPNRKSFILDSGAHPNHLNHPHPSTTPLTSPQFTHTAANHRHTVTHSGPIQIQTPSMPLNIKHAIVTPDLRHNLVSVHSLSNHHGPVTFTPSKAFIIPRGRRKPRKIAPFKRGLYVVDNKPPGFPPYQTCVTPQRQPPLAHGALLPPRRPQALRRDTHPPRTATHTSLLPMHHLKTQDPKRKRLSGIDHGAIPLLAPSRRPHVYR